ncbi:MAG TPA: hypothetical protein VHL53_04230 [Acidimicrobiia bacterium]|nr:hypothetical protein [Acidimicrobiia bacterium]
MPSHFPQPPQGLHMNTTAQAIFTIGQALPCLVMAVIAGRIWRKERSPIPALCMVGGALAIFMEPIVDVLGQVWFPRTGQWRLLETWGRPIPWFLVVYIWYVGGQAFLSYRTLERGARGRDVWRLYGIFFLVNVILETPGLYMNLYTYYGHQPLNFFRLPLWWPAVNSAMPILAGTLILVLRPYLSGWRILAVIPLIPAADGMANAAAAWPTWSALNTRLPAAVVWAAGCLTGALAALMIHFISLVAEARNTGRTPATASSPRTGVPFPPYPGKRTPVPQGRP